MTVYFIVGEVTKIASNSITPQTKLFVESILNSGMKFDT